MTWSYYATIREPANDKSKIHSVLTLFPISIAIFFMGIVIFISSMVGGFFVMMLGLVLYFYSAFLVTKEYPTKIYYIFINEKGEQKKVLAQ